jgi:DNA-binding MarR family transcriptional regulator
MSIENDIKQTKFISEYHKLAVNVLFSASWISDKNLQVMKPFKLTPQQFNILRILRGQKGSPLSVNSLIERMIDKSSNVSRLVDKLEDKGYVERKTCPSDRRQVHVIITESGLEFIGKLDEPMSKLDAHIKALSLEEAATLNHLLDKMRNSI